MTAGASGWARRALTAGFRRLGLALLTAGLMALGTATLLVAAWLVLDRAQAWTDAPYAWTGVFMVTLAFGSPGAVLFGLLVAPLAAWAGTVRPGLKWLVAALGGGALVWSTTNLQWSVLGVLGGLLFVALDARFSRRAALAVRPD